MSKTTPTRARRARLIAGAFVGAVLALGVTAGTTSASEPKPVATTVQADAESTNSFRPMFFRSGIRW